MKGKPHTKNGLRVEGRMIPDSTVVVPFCVNRNVPGAPWSERTGQYYPVGQSFVTKHCPLGR